MVSYRHEMKISTYPDNHFCTLITTYAFALKITKIKLETEKGKLVLVRYHIRIPIQHFHMLKCNNPQLDCLEWYLEFIGIFMIFSDILNYFY